MANWRAVARTVAAASVAVLVGMVPTGQAAHAEPSIQEIEKQLDEAWQQVEPLIEQYNKVHSQLQENRKKAEALQKKIQPLELQVNLALTRVGDIAAQQYKYGPANGLNAMLASGSPATLGDQLAILDHIARDEARRIADVAAARDRYGAEQNELNRLVAAEAKQDAELAARKKDIESDIKKLEKLRKQAYGSDGSAGGPLYMGPCPAVYPSNAAARTATRIACAQIGKPYVFGAVGPSTFDCSGLTQYAWGKAGVSLTHYTGSQWTQGTPVSRENARPGDLVFFYSDVHHVGMYVGDGLMVHAPTTGDVVRMQKIDVMPIAGFRRPG